MLRPVFALSVLLLPRAVFAQHREADRIARDAAEQCERGDREAALRELTRARSIEATGRVVGELALCEHRMERWFDAETHLAEALAISDDSWVRHHRAELDAALAEARLHIASLTLTCSVAGAEVRVNDQVVGRTPLAEPLRVVAGAVRVEVRAPGYRTWQRALDVYGHSAQENVGLERDAPLASTSPPPAAACPPGLVMRGGLCYAPEPTEEERSRIRPTQVVAWVGVGVTVVAGALALGVGVSGNGAERDYLARCGAPNAPAACAMDHDDTQSSLDAQAGIVNAMIGVALLGAATAVTGFALDQRAARRARIAFTGAGARVTW